MAKGFGLLVTPVNEMGDGNPAPAERGRQPDQLSHRRSTMAWMNAVNVVPLSNESTESVNLT
jgi:hypothetical protein